MRYIFICFFFQAEDGIRDLTVTGVQTCALPICKDGNNRLKCCVGVKDENSAFMGCESSGAGIFDCGSLGIASCSDARDRKSTRLNSSHSQISYAVFCLKKKNIIQNCQYRLSVTP